VPHNSSDVAICQAVAGIAQSLGLGLVAEGVENDAQRQFLIAWASASPRASCSHRG
jgi:EAL domain-containing protein (putative c-di-GMP-specific phosphodiesterase class I)